MVADPSPVGGFLRVLQGQEYSSLKPSLLDSNESDTVEKPNAWSNSVDKGKVNNANGSLKYPSENFMPSMRPEPAFADLLSGFGVQNESASGSHAPYQTTASSPMKKHMLDQDVKFNMLGSSWSIMPANLSLNLSESSMKHHSPSCNVSYQGQGSARYRGGFNEMQMLRSHRIDHQNGSWLMPPPPFYFDNHTQSRDAVTQPSQIEQEPNKPKDGSYKLFGIPLISSSTTQDSSILSRSVIEPATLISPVSLRLHNSDSDQSSEQSKSSKQMDCVPPCSEQEKKRPNSQSLSRDAQAKAHGGSSRSCTKVLGILILFFVFPLFSLLLLFLGFYVLMSQKINDKFSLFQVHKQGIALGRSVDLSKFSNYDQLVEELDCLFDFNGELKTNEKNWLIVYTDDEGDMMLVGDDPWQYVLLFLS